jgi:beta-glucosidase
VVKKWFSYIRDLFASVTRPVKELKGFEIVELKPGETKKYLLKLIKQQSNFTNSKWKAKQASLKYL